MLGEILSDVPLPQLVLRESALTHNLRAMQAWCDGHDVSLAPHGKTSMAPALIERQLAAGAWGMTAATVPQLAVMRDAGARRVVLANQLVGAPEIAGSSASARTWRSSRSSTPSPGSRRWRRASRARSPC